MELGGEVDEVSGPDIRCFNCKQLFDDPKSIVQCINCVQYFHCKCENIDLRGFHMKRSTWKCKACSETHCEVRSEVNKPERSRKRSRTDEVYVEASTIDRINAKLDMLLKNTNELNQKVDFLLAENQSLKEEILFLKENKSKDIVPSLKTYATVAKNENKILLVTQKSTQKDVSVVKQDLKNKVNPTEIGIGLSMGRSTKNGGLILNCSSEKEIISIQSEIQNKLGDSYSVDRPKIKEYRVKIVGIDESEFNKENDEIVRKVIRQNDIHHENSDFKLKIVRRSNVFNSRFNVICEVDTTTYNVFIAKGKLNIGWNRCPVYSEYGILRCFNCYRYGHLSKECKDKMTCPKCTGEHELKNCTSTDNKCINCVSSNRKYGLNLDSEHMAWDAKNCEVYKRFERMQINRFNK